MIARRRRGGLSTHPRPPPGRRRTLRRLILIAAIGVLAWLAGLIWFVGQIPRVQSAPRSSTDAIVVLTGGSGRLEVGLDLLQDGWADSLFISGVYERLDVQLLLDVFQRQVPEIACCIELGYAANNTRGNAAETAAWVQRKGIQSLRLVTSNYHMPRALLEFGRLLDGISITPHPVQPLNYDLKRWWYDPNTFRLVAWEYTKLLVAHASLLIASSRQP